MTYIYVPLRADNAWQTPSALASFPNGAKTGEVRLDTGSGTVYWWDGNSWEIVGATTGGTIYWAPPVANFAALPAGLVTGETRLTTDNYKIYTWDGAAWQLRVLRVADLTSTTDGSSAAAGIINQRLTGTQASNTSTGVGATGTWGSVTSVSLTAGRWQVQGVAGLIENGAVLTTSISVGISASATGSGIGDFDTTVAPWLVSSTSGAVLSTPVVYLSLSGTTTYHLNTRFFYTSGSPQHRGEIRATRIG